ncbi:MAG: hypothetical protein WD063_05560 [Pirellulales bacterium]
MRFVGPTVRRLLCRPLLALAACLPLSTARLWAFQGPDAQEAVAQEVSRLIGELDDPEFAKRNKAADRLEELVDRPLLAPFLSSRFRQALLSPATSFEVRSRLEPLTRSLPKTSSVEPKPSAAQIVPLLDQLNSDAYADRDSAARQLKAMLAHVELIAPVWLELERRAADPALSSSGRRALEPLVDQAHEAWLLADPEQLPLPKPPADQIAGWIDDVSRLNDLVPADLVRRTQAERKLLDLIARDDTREQMLGMLRERIAADGGAAHSPLQDLVDFARPAIAAEVWSNQLHIYQQYLIVGLPQYNEAADPPKATLFDRVDDQTAHCVSGNALNPGDYPVRVAIPHPLPGQETMYYLTNLPTPRRRLAYEYHRRRDERLRLREISERTLNYYLARGTPLGENEVLMLAQLDPRTVSRLIGTYFETVPDGSLISTLNGLISQPTVHGGIAAVISRIGTREAVPALERLARSGTLGQLSNENRLDVAWVAALAIAQRDPWPDVDEWLAQLVDEQLPLSSGLDRPPDLGASAAGLLLDRHGASTTPFGLETAGESVTDSYRFVGYRFSSQRDRQDVNRWWQRKKALARAGRAAQLTGSEPTTVPTISPGRP